MPDIKKIPVFPLPIIVFPEEELRLHIFEPRYKQLIRDCKEQGIVFGILPVLNGKMMETGTLVRLEEIVKEYEDGRMDIRLHSEGIFRVIEYYSKWPGKLYSAADMQLIEYGMNREAALDQKVKILFDELCHINHVKPFHAIAWEKFISYKLGHYVGFSLDEEYSFFTLYNEKSRLEKLIHQLEFMVEQSKQRQEWLKRMNMNGEFRNFNVNDLK